MDQQAVNPDWRERLYDERAAGLLLYGQALGLSCAEAEDVLHETFQALLRLPDMPGAPEHYLVRSFRNRALNHRRSRWRRLAREVEACRWFEPPEDESLRERAAINALATLPEDQREAIVLKIWNEMTFEQIGELLGLSPNTVAGRYRYGLQKLRACLEGECHEKTERTGSPIAIVDAASAIAGNPGAAVPRSA
jgi:RNA polymerase sigma-70 factor (ECF subfamily)